MAFLLPTNDDGFRAARPRIRFRGLCRDDLQLGPSGPPSAADPSRLVRVPRPATLVALRASSGER